jgi:hypothetical protein
VVKVHTAPKFDAESQTATGYFSRAWDEHMYEMKQLSQRKVTQQEAAAILMRCLTIPVEYG